MVHSCCYLLLIYLSGFRWKHIQNPWGTYVQMSAVLAGSHGLTKSSLAFLNYPAQLMFKSTKVLPVMLMGSCIPGMRRQYSGQDYSSAGLLVGGLLLFTLADASTSPIFSVLGVVMVCGALVLDALLGNLQEAIFTLNPATTQMEMLFCSSLMGLPFLLLPCILTGELFVAFARCLQNPFVYAVLVLEACATFIGQISVLSLVILFGAATTAMITTARKALTLALSYLVFSKPFTPQHLTGILFISVGITMKMMPPIRPPNTESSSKNETSKKVYINVPLEDPEKGKTDTLKLTRQETEPKR